MDNKERICINCSKYEVRVPEHDSGCIRLAKVNAKRKKIEKCDSYNNFKSFESKI